MPTADAIALLHLSDIQFGKYHRFEPGELAERIADDVQAVHGAGGSKPDLVLLTGDLSEWGLASELEQVESFVRCIASRLTLPVQRFVLIPGNHDINRKKCEAYFADCEGDEQKPQPPYWPKLEPYARAFARIYGDDRSFHFDEKQPWTWFEWPDLPIVVAGMNSTIADSHRPEDHHGFLGEGQLRSFETKLVQARREGKLRLVAVHHDVMRTQAATDVTEQDARDFRRIAGPHANLVLHGHTHREDLEWLGPGQPVLCIGSAGVKGAERPADVPNQYRWIELRRDGMTYRTRAWAPDQKRWIDDARADPKGASGIVVQAIVFEDVATAFPLASGAAAEPMAVRAPRIDRAVATYREHVRRAMAIYTPIAPRSFGEDEEPEPLELAALFVGPKIAPVVPTERPEPREDEPLAILPERDATPEPRPPEEPRRQASLDAEYALLSAALPWSLVLGGPGAGKTTLTRWLSLRLCESPTHFHVTVDFFPIRVHLGQYMERARSAGVHGYDFFDEAARSLREHSIPLDAANLRSRARHIFWLLDGLDEVTIAEERRECLHRIVGLKTAYAGRGVVTSRRTGAEAAIDVLGRGGIPAYEITQLDADGVADIIDRWHRAIFRRERERGERRKQRLTDALRESHALLDLTKTPLLLTLLCVLNQDGDLPRRRHLVHQRAIALLAHDWEVTKKTVDRDAPTFELADKLDFLRDLAWKMTVLPGGMGNVITEKELETFATHFAQNRFDEPIELARRTASQLVARLRKRDIVLASFGGDAFGFTHRAFLEYLAALAMVTKFRRGEWAEADLCARFAKHCRDDRWTETLTLLCGLVDGDNRPHLIVDFLQAAVTDLELNESRATQFRSLAIRCLAEAQKIDDGLAEFAHEISENVWRRRDPSSIPLLRLANDRWPDAARFRTHAFDPNTTDTVDLGWTTRAAIATSPLGKRSEIIEALAARLGGELATVVAEAGELGTWIPAEIQRLERVGETLGQVTARAIDIGLARTGVNAAAERLRRRGEPEVLLRDALAELRAGRYPKDIAPLLSAAEAGYGNSLEILALLAEARPADPSIHDAVVRCLRSPYRRVVAAAAKVGTRLGIPEAVDWLESQARSDITLIGTDDLVHAALHSPLARSRVYAILTDPTVMPEVLVGLAYSVRNDNRTLAVSTLRGIATTATSWRTRANAASALDDIDGHFDESAALLRAIARGTHDSSARAEAIRILDYIQPLDETTRSALRQLSRDADPEVMLAAAWILGNRGGTDEQTSLQAIATVARTTLEPTTRFNAAMVLRSRGRAWRELSNSVLRDLSLNATNNRVRMLAARAIADGATLAQLANRTGNDALRDAARRSLAILHMKQALLRVGKPRRGRVSLSGQAVGVLEETRNGSKFTYDTAWLARSDAVPISPTLPLRTLPFESDGLHPFFDNLLPEGFLDEASRRGTHVAEHDRFGLLLHVGADTIGAVEVTALDEDVS